MRIVFMGTPEFAAVSLRKLIKENYEICAVFTQSDKPVGRKQILTPPEVKVVAQENNISVYQPKSLKTGNAVEIIRNLNPDVIVVVAYGKILPKSILEIPRMGCINVHGSLLPKYRGAAPIQWSIINGENETGITTMFMDEGLDTGDILLQQTTKIGENETSGELFERMSVMGAELLIKTLDKLERNELQPIKQSKESSYAPILSKSEARIDFSKTASEVNNLIRGLNPWPVAYTHINGKKLKIYKSRVSSDVGAPPGKVLNIHPFVISCGEKTSLEITEVQLEGKKRMSAENFVRGTKIQKDSFLGGEA